MKDGYWEGATWIYRATITNDGTNSGTHTYSVVPGAGNEFELVAGVLFNGDTTGRVVTGMIAAPAGDVLNRLIERNDSLGAGAEQGFPSAPIVGDNAPGAAGPRYIVAGTMILRCSVAAVAINQDTAFGVTIRFRGATPVPALTSPTDAVEVVVINQVL